MKVYDGRFRISLKEILRRTFKKILKPSSHLRSTVLIATWAPRALKNGGTACRACKIMTGDVQSEPPWRRQGLAPRVDDLGADDAGWQ